MTKVNLKKIRKRFFEGKTEGFVDKQEANFEKAHLKAYLRGDVLFHYGKHRNALGQLMPNVFKVKQRIEVIEPITVPN